MTSLREQMIAKAFAYLEERYELLNYDTEQSFVAHGPTADELDNFRGHQERAMIKMREDVVGVIDEILARQGQELH